MRRETEHANSTDRQTQHGTTKACRGTRADTTPPFFWDGNDSSTVPPSGLRCASGWRLAAWPAGPARTDVRVTAYPLWSRVTGGGRNVREGQGSCYTDVLEQEARTGTTGGTAQLPTLLLPRPASLLPGLVGAATKSEKKIGEAE